MLLVEDEADLSFSIRRFLELRNYSVTETGSTSVLSPQRTMIWQRAPRKGAFASTCFIASMRSDLLYPYYGITGWISFILPKR